MPTTVAAQSGRRRPMLSEDAIHRAVVQHLAARAKSGVFFFHPANGGKRNRNEAARFVGLGVKPGVPDLIIINNGATYGLELKADKGKMSPTQRVVHSLMADAGATVAVTYGLDDALAQLDAWEIFR